jgi:hypothetical protein
VQERSRKELLARKRKGDMQEDEVRRNMCQQGKGRGTCRRMR